MGIHPKLFLDTNVCINVASGIVPHDEWQKVRKHIEEHYSYQISYVTLKELFARITRGEDAYFEENKKPLHVLCGPLQQEFLPYPPVFALRTVLGLELVPRRPQWSDFACKAIVQGFNKSQLKTGVPCADKLGQFFKFDLDHFDKHENEPQMEHLDLLQRMQAGRVEMSDWMEMAAFLLRDCRQTPDAESCSKLTNALNTAYTFSTNLGLLSKNKQKAHLEKRESDWGDIMQLYYLCDESMHFLTFDEKCRNQTKGSTQQERILLYKEFTDALLKPGDRCATRN